MITPTFELLRDGESILRSDRFITASRSRHINSADELILEAAGMLTPQTEDTIYWYEDGVRTGTYRIDTVERISAATARVNIHAQPIATWHLANTGWPGQAYQDQYTFSNLVFLEALSLTAALDRVAALTRTLDALTEGVTFVQVHPAKSTTGLRVIDADTALRALAPICAPSQSIWRCRADLAIPTIEVGTFGDVQDVEVRSLGLAPTSLPFERSTSYLAETAKLFHDDADGVNAVFVEGGSYEHVTYGSRTLTTNGAKAPAGFTHAMVPMPDGQYYALLSKDWDANHQPYKRIRSRRIHISGIAPNANKDDGKSRPEDVALAAQALIEAGAAYLKMYADGKFTWQATIPAAMSSDFNPGDKVPCTVQDASSGETYAGELYVISHTTIWRAGLVSSELELSNVPDPLRDPLSVQYAGERFDKKPANVAV